MATTTDTATANAVSVIATDAVQTTVTNSDVLTTIMTLVVPSTELEDGGYLALETAFAVTSKTGSPTCDFTVSIEGTPVVSAQFDGSTESAPWNASLRAGFVRSGSNIYLTYSSRSILATSLAITGDITILVTAQWSAANPSNTAQSLAGVAYVRAAAP